MSSTVVLILKRENGGGRDGKGEGEEGGDVQVEMKDVENLDIIMCKWRCAGGDEEVEMEVDKMM